MGGKLVVQRQSVWFFVGLTGVLFGLGTLLTKALVDSGIDAFLITWLPFIVAGSIGTVWGGAHGQLSRAALPPAILLGLISSAVPALLFNIGFEQLSAGIVTLLISLGPVVTAVAAHFAYADERFNSVKGLGLGLAVGGVGILALGSASGGSSTSGMVLVLIGSIAAGGSAALIRPIAVRHGAMALIAPQLLVAGTVIMVLASVLGRPFTPEGGFSALQVLGLIGAGLNTFVGFLCMLKANEVGTTGQVSVVGYFIPLFGVVGGIALFGDELSVSLLIGGALILVSMAAIASGSSRAGQVSGVF